ncbi:hypothetical protein AB0H76_15060 [Nocardia sp. NPDC050712]|uniref:hypothetical protein n=1 Tax=Nocardia sp. NPDC050712 TaxID=3155518 RepID=UPI0033D20BAA
MSRHLHLPHPHLPDIAEVAARVLVETRLHLARPKVAHIDPAAVARWGEWLTPEQWEDEHTGRSHQ